MQMTRYTGEDEPHEPVVSRSCVVLSLDPGTQNLGYALLRVEGDVLTLLDADTLFRGGARPGADGGGGGAGGRAPRRHRAAAAGGRQADVAAAVGPDEGAGGGLPGRARGGRAPQVPHRRGAADAAPAHVAHAELLREQDVGDRGGAAARRQVRAVVGRLVDRPRRRRALPGGLVDRQALQRRSVRRRHVRRLHQALLQRWRRPQQPPDQRQPVEGRAQDGAPVRR
eukprot:6594429-Prymnesium_polylepis.1